MAIKVEPEQLQQVSGQLSAGAGNIDATLGQLRSQVAPLGSDWAGLAQARFLELWAEWQRGATQVHDALTGISQLMAQAGTGFQTGDSEIAKTFTHR
jgi:WXG100 family type VII secretion target